MSGRRWTTGIGIAAGGVGGAVVALVGAPDEPRSAAPSLARGAAAHTTRRESTEQRALPLDRAIPQPDAPPSSSPSASTVAFASSAAPSARATVNVPALPLPTTREGLLKAELYCDQRKDFDECTRAAQALELGSAGPADPEQAKRFYRIAMTHLVTQCETGDSPHACFVLAAKYRAGTELAANPTGAEALEKRARELCRFRSAPECPPP